MYNKNMKTIKYAKNIHDFPSYLFSYFTEDSIFYDIETTGFSPRTSDLYLIGYAYRKEKELQIVQLFAETPNDQEELVQTFANTLQSFSKIISFNGIGFDQPYLEEKYKHYQLENPFSNCKPLDLYKKFYHYKELFHLENRKQRTFETFLGIKRDDPFPGGDLIPLYKSHVANPDEEVLSILLLHNYEDLLHMISLLKLFSYELFFQGGFQIKEMTVENYRNFEGKPAEELYIQLIPEYFFPQPFQHHASPYHIHAEKDHVLLSIPLLRGELRHFFTNYKDYYYLPEEDMAVYKALAGNINKDHRQNAKRSNCYIRHSSLFLPQEEEYFTPAFQQDYRDSLHYFEYEKHPYLSETHKWESYLLHILSHFLK